MTFELKSCRMSVLTLGRYRSRGQLWRRIRSLPPPSFRHKPHTPISNPSHFLGSTSRFEKMASHSLISNYDVLLRIFSNLTLAKPAMITSRRPHNFWGPDTRRKDDDYETRTTLLSAALACKTLSDIALDELWAAPRGGLYTVLRLLSNLVKEPDSYMTYRRRPAEHKITRYVSISDVM